MIRRRVRTENVNFYRPPSYAVAEGKFHVRVLVDVVGNEPALKLFPSVSYSWRMPRLIYQAENTYNIKVTVVFFQRIEEQAFGVSMLGRLYKEDRLPNDRRHVAPACFGYAISHRPIEITLFFAVVID